VRDTAEFLAQLGLRTAPTATTLTVTYQDPCHLAHGQKIRAEPRQLLAAIPGVTIREMDASDRCCGSAGIYNVLQPEMAETLLREKMEAIRATGASVVVAPNPGCMLQLRHGAKRFGVPVRVMHLMDLLDEAGA
jgi:glycolate oxidase iron-sulfur subunit